MRPSTLSQEAFVDGLRILMDLLGSCGLRYCVLHQRPRGLTGELSDLDVAVAACDVPRLEELLRRSGQVQLVQIFRHESSCYYFVLAVRCEGTVQFLALDVASDYRHHGVIFLSERQLLEERRNDDGVWRASHATEFAYLLVKKIFKRAFPEHQRMRIQVLCTSLGRDADVIARRLLGHRWGTRVGDWIRRADWISLEMHTPALKRALRWESTKRAPLGHLRYWVPEFVRRWRRWRRPTGLCIAVLGPDGAGKSSLAAGLVRELSPAFRHSRIFHFRPRLTGGKGPGRPVTDPHGRRTRGGCLSLLKLMHYAFGYVAGYLLRMRPQLVRSSLLVFDRYYHDLLVDPRRYRYGASMKLVRLVQRFIPLPDVWLILDVPEDELWRRKQEVSRAELRRQREGYLLLGRELSNAVVLNGSLAPHEVVTSAAGAIVGHLHRRYEARRCEWLRHWRDDVGMVGPE